MPEPSGHPSPSRRESTAGFEAHKQRPTHVVVFRERSEQNAGRLSEALRLKPAAKGMLRDAVDLLQPHLEHLPHTRVYQRLGLAVGSFDREHLARLESDPHVAAVEPNRVRHLPPVRYASGITASVPPEGPGTETLTWCLAALGLATQGTPPTGKGVKVAVLDTGLDRSHPDFAGRVPDDHAHSFVPGVPDADDDHGHGTHCCGLVAGPPAPAGGGARFGVAPDVELYVGKVLDKQESGTDDNILDGIDWAVELGARLISLSLGSARGPGDGFSKAYETIATSVARDGTLILGAAGNDSERDSFRRPVNNPAACPSIVAVAALDRFNRITPYSAATLDAIGRVDLGAPGDGVTSCWPGGGYRASSGTSMATPHVVGVAALLLELKPALTPAELAAWLRALALDVGLDPSDAGSGLAQCPAS